MTMHLEGPWLSKNGKRKGKQKFRNAEEARKARELEQSWNELQKKWGVEQADKKRKQGMKSPPLEYKLSVPENRSTRHLKSVESTHIGAVRSHNTQQYTGNSVIGISVMHKSCLQPVFNQEAAIDAAKMRR